MSKLFLTELFKKYGLTFKDNKINLITGDCGCGKSTFAQTYIDNFSENYVYSHRTVLYITDTNYLKIKTESDYEDFEFNDIHEVFFKESESERMTIKTYAWLGYMLKDKDRRMYLLTRFKLIFLDEVHQLFAYNFQYEKNKPKEDRLYECAIEHLDILTNYMVVVCLSATPEYLLSYLRRNDMMCFLNDITTKYKKELVSYETKNVIEFSDLKNFIKDVQDIDSKKILLFTSAIKDELKYKAILTEKGYKCECIWSENNDDYPLSDYQKQLIDRLLRGDCEFDEDVLIINRSLESGINIENSESSEKLTQCCIVNTSNYIQRTQIRGRIRHDIDYLYCKERIPNLEKESDYILVEEHLTKIYEDLFENNMSKIFELISTYEVKNFGQCCYIVNDEKLFYEILNIRKKGSTSHSVSPKVINQYLKSFDYEMNGNNYNPFPLELERIRVRENGDRVNKLIIKFRDGVVFNH